MLDGASDFGDDPILSSTDLTLAELEAQGALADLAGRTAARRAVGRGIGGAPREEGCWEALYLAYVDLGCTGFYPWCSDYPDTETVRLFAETVVPELR